MSGGYAVTGQSPRWVSQPARSRRRRKVGGTAGAAEHPGRRTPLTASGQQAPVRTYSAVDRWRRPCVRYVQGAKQSLATGTGAKRSPEGPGPRQGETPKKSSHLRHYGHNVLALTFWPEYGRGRPRAAATGLLGTRETAPACLVVQPGLLPLLCSPAKKPSWAESGSLTGYPRATDWGESPPCPSTQPMAAPASAPGSSPGLSPPLGRY